MIWDKELVIPFVTELELLSFPKLLPEAEKAIKGLLGNCLILDLNPQIKDLIISFRKKSKLKLPDSIIAASAYYSKLPLLTSGK